MTTNRELMMKARESLKGNWGLAIGALLVYGLVQGASSYIGVSLIIGGPLSLGLSMFALSIARKKEASLETLFEGFHKFAPSLVAYLLMALFTFLWTLLLIVPGIIAAISYSQAFYILADNENVTGSEAIKKSKEMMYGYKWKYFCLGWRFFGWALLCILTLGIGFLWLAPYMQVSYANFYEDLKSANTTEKKAAPAAA